MINRYFKNYNERIVILENKLYNRKPENNFLKPNFNNHKIMINLTLGKISK